MALVTAGQLATLLKVSRIAIVRRIAKYHASGQLTVIADDGKSYVDQDTFLDLVGSNVGGRAIGDVLEGFDAPDDTHAHNGNGSSALKGARSATASLTLANTRKCQATAALAELELLEKLGNVVVVEGRGGLREASILVSSAMVRSIDGINQHAWDLHEYARSNDVASFRRKLQDIVNSVKARIAQEMELLAQTGRDIEAAGGISITIEHNDADLPDWGAIKSGENNFAQKAKI
jgi:hypothetical protein